MNKNTILVTETQYILMVMLNSKLYFKGHNLSICKTHKISIFSHTKKTIKLLRGFFQKTPRREVLSLLAQGGEILYTPCFFRGHDMLYKQVRQ